MTRQQLINRTILDDLDHLPQDYLQSDAALRATVCMIVVPRPTTQELDSALRDLDSRRLITTVHNQDTGTKYSLTDAGRAVLANM